MKYHIFAIFFLSISILSLQAQEKIYSLMEVDSAPVINSCDESLDKKECFIKNLNMHVFKTMDISKLNIGKGGKAYVQFEITSDGNIRNIRARSKDKKLKKESERIMSELVIIEPARINGEAVAISQTIPVNFKSRTYNSYSDYFKNGNNELNNGSPVLSIQEVAYVPVFNECDVSKDKKECFSRFTKQKIRAFILSRKNLKNKVSSGDEIKFYFEISSKADIMNAIVASGGRELIKEITQFLRTLDIEKPAMDKNNNAVSSYYQDSLIF
ncbi:MAG: energy transducer TonB [Gillisia sp.]|nr:energy transducer TonB [Gillisia sp.]